MMRKALSIGLIALLLPLQVVAGTADECRDRVNREIAREQRLYRAYLFGKRWAKDAPVGDVRYDKDGWAWMKINDSGTPWGNSHQDNTGLKWSDKTMDKNDEHAEILPIKGIFETKRVTTSELIPYMLQSIRAFDCRLDALAEIPRISALKSGEEPEEIKKIQSAGCIAFEDLETWPECHFSLPTESELSESDSRTYADDMADQLLLREIEILKMIVEYDAGYRTLLQFAGNFDIFLREMRWPISGTLRQAVQLMGQLERIPCFLSSCDSAPRPR